MSPRTLSRILIGYMVCAFGWWAVHLWRSNDELFALEKKVLEDKYRERGVNITALQETKEYLAVSKKWRKRRRMILSEGIFFTACLVAGLWIVNRSTNREVSLARQRRNFLLSITHELKSPIAGMRLVLETLGRRELTKEQREKLCHNGVNDATRLQNLVEDLLLAARLEDKWQAFPEPIDLYKLASDIAANLRVRFPVANIRIEVSEDAPPVQADKPGITAIIQNLLENAVKYSPDGAPVVLSASQNNGKLTMLVTDQGKGIPAMEKEAVFEKFYRIGDEETRQTKGTGLGLYIVKQVLKAHGGNITVSDNTPQGTIFTVNL
ncbi:MAG: HAMP domain-containing histidine kinase [Saprospiraceae bacterium]|nr:HAMP domain-containing histidine kinase [Saprospiraceae bacterium]